METFIVFLRGINVSGKKKIKMAELKASLTKNGFDQVKSYIQSGNLILDSEMKSNSIADKVQKCIRDNFGFQVPTLVLTSTEVNTILRDIPFHNAEDKNLYFTLLHEKPDLELVEDFNSLQFENEDFFISESCVYLNCKKGAGKAKLNNNLIENKLKIIATTRNLNTMKKMLEMTSST
ncbi:DUF1697 domain-containing protein [Croceitalea rosinachiae]|uniref:DUF1697 domain-containing protein n=1 Tax=Croceitalea rosinachiae TaxID=3075596 RepID=A0ABU3A939_9FLAO|nr:DUF1697 domain-containing protein [Croceitalea sp. F388]MDT0606701.1 DUF1697 domain-containing protein [Croceitalea sp. F388]